MITLPIGAWPSPHGHSPPTETVAATKIETWLLPSPGSPAMAVCLPRAMRPGHKNSIRLGAMSAAQRDMSCARSDSAYFRQQVKPYLAKNSAEFVGEVSE